MSKLQSRRTFLKRTGLSLGGLTLLGLAGCSQPASSASVAASSQPAATAVLTETGAEITVTSHPFAS